MMMELCRLDGMALGIVMLDRLESNYRASYHTGRACDSMREVRLSMSMVEDRFLEMERMEIHRGDESGDGHTGMAGLMASKHYAVYVCTCVCTETPILEVRRFMLDQNGLRDRSVRSLTCMYGENTLGLISSRSVGMACAES